MKKYKTLLITTIYLFILNIVFSLLIYKHTNISNMFFYLLESISVSTIVLLISSFFKEKIKKVIRIILFIIISILFPAQFVHFSFYECFFSIYSLVNGGQVIAFTPAIIKIIFVNIVKFLVLLSFVIIIIIILLKIKDDEFKHKRTILGCILIINILVTIFSVYIPKSNDLYSRKNLLNSTNTETKNVQSFGLITAMTIDMQRFIFSPNYNLIKENNNLNMNKYKLNVTDIDFDNIKGNADINKLSNYFKNKKPTNQNEYTGIFKGKNLIFITAESFSFSLIDKDLTPTLYKLSNEGINFTNFYTPIYYASTSDGEYTNLTGLLPKEGTWSYLNIENNYFPYSYSNVFKNLNYDLYGYHNGVYTFYNRNTVMKSLRYEFKACGNGLEKNINCNLWPQSDYEMITETFKDYKNSKSFHTYYMSISGHLNHNFKNNDMAKKYKDYVKNLKYSEPVKAYISANIDLDKALEHLLNNLEKTNKLNDTVIVLVPDHFPYGLSNKELNELEKTNNSYDKHKSNLIIYNPSLKKTTINKYASNIDILPTLLNMFGIKYDSRLLIGTDIMSDSEGIVIFNDRSFITEYGLYNENTNTFTKFKDIDKSYIENKRKEVFNKYNASSLILKNNYYKYIK